MISSLAAAQSTTSTSTATSAQSTACGYIVNSDDPYGIFPARSIYECLISVPFNSAVATRFIAYYNDTLQFHAPLAYLKDPPSSYQQPSVDLVAGLSRLQDNIDMGLYGSQYDFETDLLRLIYAAHDGHLSLIAGALAAFAFGSPRDIVSVSTDGSSLPKVYLAEDLFRSKFFTSFQPPAIVSINGIDTVTYLEQFASNNSFGTLEPHADWNQLMLSPVGDILGYFTAFSGGARFYPGDTITWTFENGTSLTEEFIGIYLSQGPTGPLQTGGDFYNFFVLGFYPADFDPYGSNEGDETGGDSSGDDGDITTSMVATSSAPSPSSTAPPPAAMTGWNNDAYPSTPDVAQEDLGIFGGGFLSGYFLQESFIAVLSIPSFDEYGDALKTFQSTVDEFIRKAKLAGMKKVVIDVQQNVGGQPLLAIDAFQRFFPNVQPFAGSRMRAHYSADVMGTVDTTFFNNLTSGNPNFTSLIPAYYAPLSANEWVVTDRIDARTGQNFSSWSAFYGPNNTYNGDEFTNVQRYNTSSVLFNYESTSETANLTIPSAVSAKSPPWAPRDIIILSDGGLPRDGPMQAPSGSRGASVYGLDVLDSNIEFAQRLLQWIESPNATFLPNRTLANDVFVLDATVNLRDQVRRDQSTPLQFAYLPADCRIYFTPQTVYNNTGLWQYAADAIWSNSSLCLPGSTGHTDSISAGPVGYGRVDSPQPAVLDLGGGASNRTDLLAEDLLISPDGSNPRTKLPTTKLQECGKGNGCGFKMVCASQKRCNSEDPHLYCVSECTLLNGRCPDSRGGFGICRAHSTTDRMVGSQTRNIGYCDVKPPTCDGERRQFGAGPLL
ncbi:hypothetical protein F5Y08DRAFT_349398 [Xylaria arbuscula]|nr:hypothetical protein F5Y08DRAFT_349398 [Xylaria arbuscula]